MEVHTCNPNTWEADERGAQVQSQPELYTARACVKEILY
jgi:hypothetical protein